MRIYCRTYVYKVNVISEMARLESYQRLDYIISLYYLMKSILISFFQKQSNVKLLEINLLTDDFPI